MRLDSAWIHVAILAILLTGSVTLNVVQHRNRESLKASLTSLGYTKYGVGKNPGDQAVPISVKTLDGKPTELRATPGERLLIYVFSPECGWCTKNLPNFRTLAQNAPGRYRLAALSIRRAGLAEYVKANDFNVPVYMEPSYDSQNTYNIAATPMTILISAAGVVEATWRGAYARELQSEVERTLGFTLPGLAASF